MVDIATPTVSSRARSPSPKTPLADDETFRVAEELMLLSASRARGVQIGAHDSAGTMKAPQVDETNGQQRKRQKALTAQFELLMSPTSSESSQTRKRARRNPITHELKDILNSRVDVSHSQLLNEHRTHFRRARRRWTIERANRQKALLEGFKVQGIPLVQHLASLTHWR